MLRLTSYMSGNDGENSGVLTAKLDGTLCWLEPRSVDAAPQFSKGVAHVSTRQHTA
ncbi:hypothetical protein M6B38_343375 [Iris pallida]|uniref:Uncharacterized protein n=1 Tax=Iris pallida TaxID=29817 RepID=A0AAX6GV23_IRIPA|nr:hypothetical protein M6B38_343375 [Iris pallida]